jgi:hypothetical protein
VKLFGQVVRTLVNVVVLPVEVAKDFFTLGGVIVEKPSFTVEQLKKIKDEAGEE